MVIAVTNAVSLHVNEEATWGETPSSPDMRQLRFTGETLNFKKSTVQSETIRADRMRDQMALVGFNTEGDYNFELAAFEPDNFFEGGLYGTWTGAQTITGTTIAFTSTAITDSANGLAGIPVNSYIWVSGAANKANNRRYRVTASAAGTITTSPAPAGTASSGATITISTGGVNVLTAVTTLIAAVVASTKTLTFSGSTGFNPSTGTNFVPGQFIRLAGFAQAGNNGIKRVASVTATTIVFVDTMVDETVTAATNLKFIGRRLRNGAIQRSYHLQKGFTDIAQYMSLRGMRVGTVKLSAQAQQIITGSFSFMGKTMVRGTSATAATTQATTTSTVMTGSAHIGTIYQNGAAIAAGIKSVELSVDNNLRSSMQIGNLSAYAVGYGFQDVTGKIEIYFEDNTIYDQLINHTSTEFSFPVTDDAGNTYQFTLPSVLFTDGYPGASGGNADVMLPLDFQAIRNPTYDCQIQIDLMPTLT